MLIEVHEDPEHAHRDLGGFINAQNLIVSNFL
jgi:hypothetical protein